MMMANEGFVQEDDNSSLAVTSSGTNPKYHSSFIPLIPHRHLYMDPNHHV